MLKNPKVTPRALTAKEKEDRANDVYDSFANYLCFCPGCSYVDTGEMPRLRTVRLDLRLPVGQYNRICEILTEKGQRLC